MTEQRTDAWFAERAGKITASRMHDVMKLPSGDVFKSGPRKGKPKDPPKARTDYIHQLAAERLTGRPKDRVTARTLEWGEDVEPAARAAYQARTGVIVRLCGFIQHPEHDFIGASPDFLVGEDGGGEIKCPASQDVHLATLLSGLPGEHIEQIQGGLWVTGRQWWDFVSYHPDFAAPHNLFVQRVNRDQTYIDQLEAACLSLEDEVRAIVDQLSHNAREAA